MSQMRVAVDKEGFLRNLSDWSEPVAQQLANQDDIELTADHWEVINIVRAYYRDHHISPVTRVLINIIKKNLGAEKGQIHGSQRPSERPSEVGDPDSLQRKTSGRVSRRSFGGFDFFDVTQDLVRVLSQ